MQSVSLSFSRVLKTKLLKAKKYVQKAFSSKFLLLTNIGISVTSSGLGDIIEQNYEIYNEELDKYSLKRTHHMGVAGISTGIICHYWYNYLDKKFPEKTFKVVCKKVFIDQLVASPLCITAFFLTLTILEGNWKKNPEFIEKIKEKAWKLYTAEWVIWPPAQLVNFYFVPLKYRVLYDNTISLGYDIYTSHVFHESKKNEVCNKKKLRVN